MTATQTFTEELCQAIEIAQALAKEHRNDLFSAAHLLKGLLHNEIGLSTTLAAWGKDIHFLRDWADIRIEDAPKSGQLNSTPKGDEKVIATLEVADITRMKLGEPLISPLAVLAAMTKPNVAFSTEQLKSFSISEKEIMAASLSVSAIQDAVSPAPNGNGKHQPTATIQKGQKALYQYCTNKTELAAAGIIDAIIGREKETYKMMEILGRRVKPNPIIVGDPGVGKTALVEGFAINISQGKVPESLKNTTLFELDAGALLAGASYKGEIEDRLKKIINELKQLDKSILFIDEIHQLLNNNAGFGGAANLLKPELARGEITVIGATTNKEYREYIEKDPAFSRRFDKIIVEEPNSVTAIRMLQKVAPRYETHHQISISPAAIREAVHLAKRYFHEKKLPDTAIDLVDRTMAAVKMMTSDSSQTLEGLEKTVNQLNEENELADYHWQFQQIQNQLSPILTGQLEEVIDFWEIKDKTILKNHLKTVLKELKKLAKNAKKSITPIDIAAVVAHKTGIPIGKLQQAERERLLGMVSELQTRVVGQDTALEVVSNAILESRAGLKKRGMPIGSFFFSGPTGTGKTELAKTLAEFLFNDETALIRFDMSEFKEAHSAALLYGTPPGYVGYKEGGLLVNKIRQKPYSIVLFDEIEKAHESIFDVFLQILDEGKLSDKQGNKGDFSNAIILFTSNLGQQKIVDFFEKNKTLQDSDTLREMLKHLKQPNGKAVFRPEFLGRMDAIVPFAPITEEVVEIIFEIQMKGLKKALTQQGVELKLSTAAKKHLAFKGFNPQFGARPIRGIIRNELRQPLAQKIIAQKIVAGTKVTLDYEKEELIWNIQN